MLNDFSTYLEILAVIYTSMCMDDILKNVWSPDYYNDLESALNDYKIDGHEALITRIVNTNKEKAKSIKRFMQKRAALFLLIIILLILLSSYECVFHSDTSKSLYVDTIHFTMFSLIVTTFSSLFGNKYFYTSNQSTAVSIFVILLITAIIVCLNNFYWRLSIDGVWFISFLLILLTMPIVWQLFVCWMFSSAYKGYIANKLASEKVKYDRVIKGINEHNPEIIPQSYKTILTEMSIRLENKDEAIKTAIDTYVEEMENKVTKASDPRSVFKIFFSWIVYHIVDIWDSLLKLMKIRKSRTISQS